MENINLEELPDVFGVESCARLLGLSPGSVYKWAKNGKLPAVALSDGGATTWLFYKGAIERWLEGQLEVDGGELDGA